MNYHGTIKIRASVSDSRGRWSDTREVSVTVLEYFAPALSFSRARTGSTSSTLTVTRNAKIASLTVSGSQKNSMRLTFKVARLGTTNFQVDTGPATGSWTSISNLVNSQANLAGNYLSNQSWVVIGTLEDKFTQTEFMINVATESVVLSYDRSGVGVNKIRERGALDVKGAIYVDDKPIQQYQLTGNDGTSIFTKENPDNILKNGMYYSWSAPNRPRNQNGWLLVQVYADAQYAVQTYWTATTETMLVRYRMANRWSDWKEVATIQKTVTKKIDAGWGVKLNATRNGNTITLSTEHVISNINTESDYRELRETLPAGFRPAQEAHLVLQAHSGSTVAGTAILHMAPDGKIRLTSKSPGNKYWTGTITYITSDPYP